MKPQSVLPIFVFLCFLFCMLSCRKTDLLIKSYSDRETVAKFLKLPPSSSPEAKRIANRLKTLNKRTGFLSTIATQDGFAVWDKAVMKIKKSKSSKVAARSNSSNDTIVIIPLVLENGDHVNAFICARLSDSINLKLYRAKDYVSYGFGGIQDTTINAEKLAIQFMLLDYSTFGYKNFNVLDNRLLQNDSIAVGTLTKNKTVHVEKSTINQARGFEIWDYDVCTTTSYLNCNSNHQCCPEGSCPGCQAACWFTNTVCEKVSVLVAVEDEWNPGGGGIDPNDGGGGPSGGNGSYGPTPCNLTPSLDNGLIPCPNGNTTGWISVTEKISYILNLSQLQSHWLEDNSLRANEMLHYLETSTNNQATTIALGHLDRMMDDLHYFAFVQQHYNPNNQVMWWEDYNFLAPYGGTSYGNWAINYLLQRPNVNFEIFQNQFMTPSEGEDGSYDNIYWDSPNLTFPPQDLPSWNDFKTAYPKHNDDPLYDSPLKLYTSVGGTILNMYNSNPSKFQNTCALRISKALNYSGVTIDAGTDRFQGSDGKYYFVSAVALLKWMKKTFGVPSGNNYLTGSQGGVNGQNFPNLVASKNGIYIMIPNFPGGCPSALDPQGTGFCASGHADILTDGSCDGGCYFSALGGVSEIFIWELQ